MTAYSDFCAAHGMNAWHPRSWSDEQVALHQAWKLANFKAKWGAYKTQGIGKWMSHDLIRDKVAHDVYNLRKLAPSRPWYGSCPCHAPVWDQGAREKVRHGLDFVRSFRRG